METKEIKDGIVLTIPDDVDYILVHHKKGSATSGISLKADGLNLMALATAALKAALKTDILNILNTPITEQSSDAEVKNNFAILSVITWNMTTNVVRLHVMALRP